MSAGAFLGVGRLRVVYIFEACKIGCVVGVLPEADTGGSGTGGGGRVCVGR